MNCSEKGCNRKVRARNLCGSHYWKKRTSGELRKLEPSELNQEKRNREWFGCTTCGKEFYRRPSEIRSRGIGFYCSQTCWRERNKSRICSVGDCNKNVRSLGLCKKHYSRNRRNGDPLIKKHEANGSPNIKGYRKKRIGDRIITEHQWIVEKLIGRRLKKGESVHHIDGNKLNNEPKNLMLFKSHSAHRQHENRYREYLEMCIREGFLIWAKEPPGFEHNSMKFV